MAWACSALFFLCALLGKKLMKQWWNLLTAFSAFYAIIISLGSLRLYGIKEASMDTYVVLILGIVFFTMGFLVMVALYQKRYRNTRMYGEAYIYENSIRKNALRIILTVVILYSVYRFAQIIGDVLSGISYQALRSRYFSDNESGINRFDYFIYLPLLQMEVILGTIVYFSDSVMYSFQRRKVLIATLACVLLAMFSNGGREILFYTTLIIVYAYFVNKVKTKEDLSEWWQSRKQGKGLKVVLLIGCVGLVAMTLLRSTTGESSLSFVLRKAYMYFAGWLPNLSEHLSRVGKDDHTYGLAFILGLLRLPAAFIHSVIPKSDVYAMAEAVTHNLQEMIYIGGGHHFNAFVSLFYYFYRDFGLVGVALESFIFGGFCARVEMKYRIRKDSKSLFWLLFAFYLIISSMVRWELVHIRTGMIFYYAPLCFRKTVRRRE